MQQNLELIEAQFCHLLVDVLLSDQTKMAFSLKSLHVCESQKNMSGSLYH